MRSNQSIIGSARARINLWKDLMGMPSKNIGRYLMGLSDGLFSLVMATTKDLLHILGILMRRKHDEKSQNKDFMHCHNGKSATNRCC